MKPVDVLGQLFPAATPYVVGLGLVALGVYEFTQGDVTHALTHVGAGIALFKVHHTASNPVSPVLEN